MDACNSINVNFWTTKGLAAPRRRNLTKRPELFHYNNKHGGRPLGPRRATTALHAIGYLLVDAGLTPRPLPYKGTAVVALTRSSTKLVLQSCTLGCLSRVSMMKRL